MITFRSPLVITLFFTMTIAGTTNLVQAQFCCSWNYESCGSDAYCSAAKVNCEVNCNGIWMDPAVGIPEGDYCCSWDGSCGDSFYCNALQSNCERDCNGTWSARSSGGDSPPTPALNTPTEAPIAPTEAPIPPTQQNPAPSSTGATTKPGELTWWTSSYGAVQGGSCEYAHVDSVSEGDLWNVPYVHTGMHCAVSSDLFNDGEGCGKCFELDYGGEGGTNPSSAGSAIVQVTNSGAGGLHHFDCFEDAFFQLTGTTTGIFPISYREMDCPEATNVYIVVLGGSNPWYVKVLVAGGHTSVSAMSIELDGTTISMRRNSGATWAANGLGDRKGPARFVVTFSDRSTQTMDNCFPEWPVVGTGAQCSS